MKRISVIAVASLAFLSVGASVEAATDTKVAQNQESSTLYCWKNKLYPAGNDLVCNWSDNTADACRGGPVSNLSKDAVVAEPANAKRCDNGEWLVRVTKK